MKKILSSIAAILSIGCFNFVSIPTVSAATVGPVLQSVQLGKASVDVTNGSATIPITVKVSDTDSTLQGAGIEGGSPDGQQSFGIGLTQTSPGVFTGTITIPQYSEAGTWSVSDINVWDQADNDNYFYDGTDYTGDFTVNDSNPDTTAPVLDSVSLNTNQVNDGGSVVVTVKAHDDLSGIQSVSLEGESPAGDQPLDVTLHQVSTGVWQGTFNVPKDAEAGTWTFEYADLTDNCYNDGEYGVSTSFTVVSGTQDVTPPTLLSVSVNPSSVYSGHWLKIVVSASDNLSGINSVTFEASSPSGNQHIGGRLSSKDSYGNYYTYVYIPTGSEIGTWTVDDICLTDNAGNSAYYYNGTDYNQTFTVQ